MSEMDADLQSLPLTFSQDFLPERRLLSRILSFAAEGGSGDKVQIGSETGIPTGESSGKVEPMIHYASGMGLIHTKKKGGQWQISLTTLGQLVITEDPYLSESVTLWLLHLLFCRRSNLNEPASGIADAWFALFGEGALRLGNPFSQEAFLDYLTERHGNKNYLKGLSGLVLRSYLEPMCFGSINAISTEMVDALTLYLRHGAPIESTHFPAYSAYLFLIWDGLYANHSQLAIDELFTQSRCLAVMGWDRAMATRWLDWMADHGLIQLDRQTGATLALRLQDTNVVIAGIFSELI